MDVEADLYNTGKHVIAVIFQQILLSSIHAYQGTYHVVVDVNQEKKKNSFTWCFWAKSLNFLLQAGQKDVK